MNITDFFDTIINKTSTLEEALDYFNNRISENRYLKIIYSQWCFEMGYKLKHGFKEYYYEYSSNNYLDYRNLCENDEDFYEYISYNL
ncbi:MAG: hypothetical protein WCQ30_00400 [Bacteroidales bacterium]|nr:hypothetical protein [Bacteroidales bacterium]